MHSTGFEAARLTVRLDAVAANYHRFVQLCGPAAIAPAVKADAYGFGAPRIVDTLARAGCETFFVARLEEGIAIRPLVPHARIFVLDGAQDGTAPALIAHRLTPVLNSLSEIDGWRVAARKQHGGPLDCAIHIDSGMNCLGLPAEERETLCSEASERLSELNVVLWMSHLACADNCASPMNRQQLERFRAVLARLPHAPASLAASAGALLGKEYHFDLVRPGIGIYGGNPCLDQPNPFAVVAVLAGRILQLRRVDRDETVGYGASFRLARPSLLATVGLGYADGLMRAIGNKGFAAIAGVRAPVVGRVSMDLITLDVTDAPSDALAAGADVEFVGDIVTLEEFAALAGTANYEILTSLGHRVPRHYEPAA